MDTKELTLLLVGAAIGLVSSLITSVVTALITYWIAKRQKRDETIGKIHYTAGKASTVFGREVKEWLDTWSGLIRDVEKDLKDKNFSQYVDGLLGFYEGAYDHFQKMNQEYEEMKKEEKELKKTLKSKDQQIQKLKQEEKGLKELFTSKDPKILELIPEEQVLVKKVQLLKKIGFYLCG